MSGKDVIIYNRTYKEISKPRVKIKTITGKTQLTQLENGLSQIYSHFTDVEGYIGSK